MFCKNCWKPTTLGMLATCDAGVSLKCIRMVVACGHSWICKNTQKRVSHSSSWFFSENWHPLHPFRMGAKKNLSPKMMKEREKPSKKHPKKRWKMKELSPIPPKKKHQRWKSGDSWMYPYQRTPMGNPYIRPIYPLRKRTANFFPSIFLLAPRHGLQGSGSYHLRIQQKNPDIFHGNLRCFYPPKCQGT